MTFSDVHPPSEEVRTTHQHIAERCIHGATRRNLCDHRLPWWSWRVRGVECAPSFCETARRELEIRREVTQAGPEAADPLYWREHCMHGVSFVDECDGCNALARLDAQEVKR